MDEIVIEETKAPERVKKSFNILKLTPILICIPILWMLSLSPTKKEEVVVAKPEVKVEQVAKVDTEEEKLIKYQKKANPKLPIEIAKAQASLLVSIAEKENIDIELLVGIAQAESNFNPLAVSPVGATGLMQILSGNEPIDESKRYDLEYNITMGCKILKEKLTNRDGDLSQALTDYSGGAKWYVEKIYTNFVKYRMYRLSTVVKVEEPSQQRITMDPPVRKKQSSPSK